MTLAPPLLWLGAPAAAMRFLVCSRRSVCWVVAAVVLVGWHVPAVFTMGMRSPAWHAIQRASFLGSGLLFWLPVVQAASRAPTDARWSIVVYLFLATLPCDVLSAFLTFSERVVYPIYFTTARHSALTVLADQACAGAVMWTVVTIVYLVVGAIFTTQSLTVGHRRESIRASLQTVADS
jgi:putative membrane protein